MIIFSLLSALSGMATGLMSLLLVRIVMGVFEGPVASTGVAVAVEASHPKRRGMNNGIFQCTVSLFGSGIGPILATQLLVITTWRHVFWIVGLPGLVIAAILWFVVREPAALAAQRGSAVVARASFWALFKHRNILLAMATLLCAMTGIFVLSAMVPSYLTDFVKVPSTQMGFVTSAIGFGGALGQFGLLTMSDFIGRRRPPCCPSSLRQCFCGCSFTPDPARRCCSDCCLWHPCSTSAHWRFWRVPFRLKRHPRAWWPRPRDLSLAQVRSLAAVSLR